MQPNPPWTPQQQTLLNRAADFYHQALLKNPEAQRAIAGIGLSDPALLATFRVGYVDGTIRDALPNQGELIDDLTLVGILDGRGKERFAGCVVFPITDAPGNVVQMYGRPVVGHGTRDIYLSHRKTGIWNRSCVRAHTRLLLCPSPFEAALLWQAGFRNAMSCHCSKGLTEDLLTLLREHQTESVHIVGLAGVTFKTISKRLNVEGLEVFTVRLPQGESIAQFLQTHTGEDLKTLLQGAEKVEPKARSLGHRVPRHAMPHSDAEQIEVLPGGVRFRYAANTEGHLRTYVVRLVDHDPSRLRATVKALTEDRNRFHLDTVDLLSARSRKAFAADAAELSGEDPATLMSDLNRIVAHFEEQTLQPQPMVEHGGHGLTADERKDAELLGQRPDLMEVIAQDMERSGYIGERNNALVAYLAMTSRKLDDPLALLIVSCSGAGKNALQEAALAFCPPEDVVKVTSMTGRALFYREERSRTSRLCSSALGACH